MARAWKTTRDRMSAARQAWEQKLRLFRNRGQASGGSARRACLKDPDRWRIGISAEPRPYLRSTFHSDHPYSIRRGRARIEFPRYGRPWGPFARARGG